MKKKCCILLAVLCMLCLFGCGEDEPAVTARRKTVTDVLLPEWPEEVVYSSDVVSIDASRTRDGYISVRYSGEVPKVKLQITIPSGTVYTYTMKTGNYEVFPLQGGNGSYHVDVYENAYDKMYALAFSQQIDVILDNEFSPYLYPNQYVWYTADSRVYPEARRLSGESADDLDYVKHVYDYMIENVTYDHALAESVQSGYLPVVDRTLSTKTGICFDYAALMTSLLRVQGIPTKLVIGYSGELYHAWIDVYLKEEGWVNKIIYFDGHSWSLMDPTLGANASSSKVKKYVGDGSHYTEKFHY